MKEELRARFIYFATLKGSVKLISQIQTIGS